MPRFWINPGDGWVEITHRINLTEPPTLTEKAEEGATGMSVLVIDDRDLSLEITPLTLFAATEDASESDDEIWASGIIANRTVGRIVESRRDPLGRYWACDVVDENRRWHWRVFKNAEANRGEETDNERVEWTLAQMVTQGLLDDDTTFVASGAESGDLDADDLRGRYPDDVMSATAERKSKNWWIQRQGAIGSMSDVAWWGKNGNSAYSSTLFLTNDLAEIGPRVQDIAAGTSDVWPLRMDHGLRCITERLYSGAYARHRSGAVYRRDASSVAAFGIRDVVMAGTEQLTKARAISRAARYLEDLGAEEYRVEGSVRLSAAKNTSLRAGMRIPVRMTHWPFGLDEWTWWRVVSCGKTPAVRGPWYDLDVELVSTGDAASGPPDPPFEGDAIAAYAITGEPANETAEDIGAFTGDGPPAGYTHIITTGPLVPTAGDPASIEATSAIEVRICAETWVRTVVDHPASATLEVRVNGDIVGSDTVSVVPSGIDFWAAQMVVDLGNVLLAAGDIVSHRTIPSGGYGGSFGEHDGASKWSTILLVGRGTHTIPQQSEWAGTWVGP